MRILHIDTGRQMRGGQYQVLLLRAALAEADCDQTLLAGDAIRTAADVEPVGALAIRKHARQCDLIHAHDARAHTLALIHGRGKPVIVARRVAFPVRRSLASRWKYSRADHYIAISQHVASVLRSGGVSAQRISVVYDAAPRESETHRTDSPDQPATTSKAGSFRVVAPDSDDPLKGRNLAVAACRLAGVDLVLAKNLSSELEGADALLYLSHSEGLGSAILLAMMRGIPAVASNVGGIPEIVSDTVTGLLVENRAESIAATLRRLRDDPALRERMGVAARNRVQSEFTEERLASQTMQVYREVLVRSRGRRTGTPG